MSTPATSFTSPFSWSVRMIFAASFRCRAIAASGSRFHSCNASVFVICYLTRLRYNYHTLTLKGEGAKVVVAVDVFDGKAGLFKQKFHLGALEEVDVGGDYRTVDRAVLLVLIVKMGQL